MKRQQIENLFTNPIETMMKGLWFSGVEGEGKYKEWNINGQLTAHCFFKKGMCDGEFKIWHNNGELAVHKLYKEGKVIKDYLV